MRARAIWRHRAFSGAEGLKEYQEDYADPFIKILKEYQTKLPIVVFAFRQPVVSSQFRSGRTPALLEYNPAQRYDINLPSPSPMSCSAAHLSPQNVVSLFVLAAC